MRKYIIMGPQGSGKGTQAKRLCSEFDMVHISVGEIFRWHVQKHTKLGARIRRLVNVGKLVPDELVYDVVSERLDMHDWNFGFVLDGFPRNRPQAEFFLESYDIDAVILLDVSEEEVMERVLSRRLCANCGLDYNLIYHRPEVEDTCDVCGGRLIQREDDTPDALRDRLNTYRENFDPIVELFRRKELIFQVDADKSVDVVTDEIKSVLNLTANI